MADEVKKPEEVKAAAPVEGGEAQEPSQGRDGGCPGRKQRRGSDCPGACQGFSEFPG